MDGNALGGLLIEVFGHEMTDSQGSCLNCGAVNEFGALIVYRSGPGDVLRCPGCDSVLMVGTRRSPTVRGSTSGPCCGSRRRPDLTRLFTRRGSEAPPRAG